jgi:hypothetical protein
MRRERIRMKLEGRAKDSLNVKETFTAGYL